MTQEEKQLLLKDLCARIPHTPLVLLNGKEHCLLTGIDGEKVYLNTDSEPFDLSESSIKPYLRPMSNMTEEEFQELHSICPHSTFNKTNVPGWIIGIDGSEYGRISRIDEISKLIDWLNAHYFDYRGLIEKGLALEAPEGMYKTE